MNTTPSRHIGLAAIVLGLMIFPAFGQSREEQDKARAEQEHAALVEKIVALSDEQAQILSERQVDLYWRQHGPRYANAYTVVDGHFVAAAKYHPGFKSSRHESVQSYLTKHSTQSEAKFGNLIFTRNVAPPRAEAEAAAYVMPAVEPGEYGYIRSATVLEVVGPQELILTNINLIDAKEVNDEMSRERAAMRANVDQQVREIEQRRAEEIANQRRLEPNNRTRVHFERIDRGEYYKQIDEYLEDRYAVRQELIKAQSQLGRIRLKVLGVDTENLNRGDTWGEQRIHAAGSIQGTSLVIIGVEDEGRASSRRRSGTMLAIPADAMRRNISLDQFARVIEQAGLTQEHFARLHIEEMRNNPQTAIESVVARIEALRDLRRQFVDFEQVNTAEGGELTGPQSSPEAPAEESVPSGPIPRAVR